MLAKKLIFYRSMMLSIVTATYALPVMSKFNVDFIIAIPEKALHFFPSANILFILQNSGFNFKKDDISSFN